MPVPFSERFSDRLLLYKYTSFRKVSISAVSAVSDFEPNRQRQPASADRESRLAAEAPTHDSRSHSREVQPAFVESASVVERVEAAEVFASAQATHRQPRRISPWMIAVFAAAPLAAAMAGYVLLSLVAPDLDFLGLFGKRSGDSAASSHSASSSAQSEDADGRQAERSNRFGSADKSGSAR